MDFILGAFLHTGQSLPYQNEMVENYLQEARRRFDAEEEARKRERAEQLEAEERRKREIYLNGGYLECQNAGKFFFLSSIVFFVPNNPKDKCFCIVLQQDITLKWHY